MATINGSIFGDRGIFGLLGTSEADTIDGHEDYDWLFGFEGNDTLIGGTGADFMDGGAGDDTYFVDNAGDRIAEDTAIGGGGVDLVKTTVSYRLPGAAEYTTPGGAAAEGDNRIENLTLLEAGGAINGTGNEYDNTISGNSFGNTLDGGGGRDNLFGFDGDDRLFGGTNADILSGGIGNDTLDGGTGADQMFGASGNDVYFVDNAGDVVSEFLGSGDDAVFSTVTFTLPSGVESLVLEGTDPTNGRGNDLDNVISGNESDNTLRGLDGEDILAGGGGDDTLFGGNNNDTLWGNENNDTLNGGGGTDEMIGGTGDDTYSVDNVGDIVEELLNQGIDTVEVGGDLTNYTLTANVENLTLLTGVNGTGNNLANEMIGNLLDNSLNGRGGADRMEGRLGNDTYFVDNANDVVIESAEQGVDTVFAIVSYTLAAGVSVETLATTNPNGTTAINLTGNGIVNEITGNNASNTLNGGGGADTLIGRGGDDTYVVDNAGDVVIELNGAVQGIDKVNASISLLALADNVENVTLLGTASINANGNTLDNFMEGNTGRNTLDGGIGQDELHGFGDNDFLFGGTEDDKLFGDGGSDRLVGSLGADKLTGGTGADIFEFRSAEDSGFNGAADEILDFSAAQADKIDLSQIDANSLVGGDQAFTFIGNNNAFSGVAGQLRFNGGQLEGDLNGDGNGDFRIQVNTPSLVAADFIL